MAKLTRPCHTFLILQLLVKEFTSARQDIKNFILYCIIVSLPSIHLWYFIVDKSLTSLADLASYSLIGCLTLLARQLSSKKLTAPIFQDNLCSLMPLTCLPTCMIYALSPITDILVKPGHLLTRCNVFTGKNDK